MTESKRTFQITLPTLHWRRIFSWKTLCFALSIAFASLLLYWWKDVRPFVSIPGGILQVSVREIVAEQGGIATEFLSDDIFKKGQVLVSTKDPFLQVEQQVIQQKLDQYKKEIEGLQVKFDQNMQQYVYLQNELEAQIGPTELSDQIFGEIQKLQERIQRLEHETENLEVSRSTIADKLEAQVVFAPFEGIVLQRLKQEGERVAKGESLLKICDQKHRWIEADIAEKLLGNVRLGLPVQIYFSAFPGKKWDGKVSWISPVVESGKVKIRLTADLLPLLPGLSAQTYIKIH